MGSTVTPLQNLPLDHWRGDTLKYTLEIIIKEKLQFCLVRFLFTLIPN